MIIGDGIDSNLPGGLIRVFVAIDIPTEIKDEIANVQGQLKRLDLFSGKYVDSSHAHLTLKFIGYIYPSALTSIMKALKSIQFKPIEATLGNIGIFKEGDFIRVIWLDIISQEIYSLAHNIEKSLSGGLVSRNKSFQSHMTLARVKSVKDVDMFMERIKEIKVKSISFTIDRLVIKQSNLTQDGPIYSNIEYFYASK